MSGPHASRESGPSAGPPQPTFANPLLDAFNLAMSSGGDLDARRSELIARYGFAIPTDQALDGISRCSPAGVVEIGAGTGYWAHALQQRGVDVAAFDIEPAPSPDSTWFAGTRPWHVVHHGDHTVAARHADRTLLIVWPTKNEVWAAAAAEEYYGAGGACLVYVGEGPAGRTGDDTFHALLGGIGRCAQCEYRSTTSPCVCGVTARWRRTETITLPRWPGYDDDLHIYTRQARRRPSSSLRRWGRPRS